MPLKRNENPANDLIMSVQKPFSQACENNKTPILNVLRQVLTESADVLEIGSGTGQHAVYFGAQLPHLNWQPSDQDQYLDGCRQWVREAGLANVHEPVELDVLHTPWPVSHCEAAFAANTAHIMHWPAVEAMFAGVSNILARDGRFCLYGPFKYGGQHTSESNARFDRDLQQRDAAMGIRDRDDLCRLAQENQLELEADHPMPANNRTLVWRRKDAGQTGD